MTINKPSVLSLRILIIISQLNSHRSTKNGRPRDMGNFIQCSIGRGRFFNEGIMLAFKISTGLVAACDRLKPSAMG